MMLVGASFTLGTSMVGSLGYYATVYYVCGGDSVAGNNWNFWMGIAFMIGGVIGAPLLNRVAYAIGKRNALVVTACIGMVSFGGSWYLYNPAIQWLQTIASGLMGFTNAGLWMLHSSIGADVIDYDELDTGKRREGSFTGCAQYILKLGNSGGYFVSGLILGWTGFKASLGAQSADTIFWIRAMLATIPVVGLTLVVIFILRLPLTKQKCLEIRTALEARRGKV
jgi:GPH family glycoside/pentoside/hexuronide:cation symporter